MPRVVVFTEGQSELVFVRTTLLLCIDNSKLGFHCLTLRGGRFKTSVYRYGSQDREAYFLIVDAGGDASVLTAMLNRERGLFQKGYDRIIGLRDMYSQAYLRKAGRKVDENVINVFKNNAECTLQRTSNPGKIRLHYAIMELEAWFLGMHDLFARIDARLSVECVKQAVGMELDKIDPQKEFVKPANKLAAILQLIGWQYRKSQRDAERICSLLTIQDYGDATKNGRCSSFAGFRADLLGDPVTSLS